MRGAGPYKGDALTQVSQYFSRLCPLFVKEGRYRTDTTGGASKSGASMRVWQFKVRGAERGRGSSR